MNAPKTMRAVVHAPGEPLRLDEIATPAPGPAEILVRVEAASVNRPDLNRPPVWCIRPKPFTGREARTTMRR